MTPLSLYEKLFVVGLFLVIVFFGLFYLTESPPFSFDEGWAVQVATNISRSGVDGLQFSPGNIEHISILTSLGYPVTYTLALWFELFGSGLVQARLFMIVWMLAIAAVNFYLLRRLFGNNIIAIASLALLATFPPFYAFGKSVMGEVPVQFFITLFLLFFNLAVSHVERRTFWLVMCGCAAGLCVVTKTMALAFTPVLLVGAFLAWKRGLAVGKDIGIVILSSIVPVVVWIFVNFQAGDSFASVIDYYSNPAALTDKNAIFWSNLKKLFTQVGPLYTLGLVAIWMSGIALRMKGRVKVYIEEYVAFIFASFILVSFLFRYGDARYLFPVQILAIMFTPFSLYYITTKLLVICDMVKRIRVYVVLVSFLSLLGLYQLGFNSYVADFYGTNNHRELAAYFSSISSSTTVLFYNTPHVVPLFGGRDYYQRIVMFEKWVLGRDFSSLIDSESIDILVLNHVSRSDQKVSLDKFENIAQFNKISVFKRKNLDLP